MRWISQEMTGKIGTQETTRHKRGRERERLLGGGGGEGGEDRKMHLNRPTARPRAKTARGPPPSLLPSLSLSLAPLPRGVCHVCTTQLHLGLAALKAAASRGLDGWTRRRLWVLWRSVVGIGGVCWCQRLKRCLSVWSNWIAYRRVHSTIRFLKGSTLRQGNDVQSV